MESFNKLPFKLKKNFFYAGIGNRKTPLKEIEEMKRIAKRLEKRGYTLRTGDATGADQAFRDAVEIKEVFSAKDATPYTIDVAREIHPAPDSLSPYVLKLQARNCFQIFGINLDDPIDFVICWTPDGMEHHDKRTRRSGGTGQAIDMASRKNIPIINLKNKGWEKKLDQLVNDSEQMDLF
jgi:hypothetical protein